MGQAAVTTPRKSDIGEPVWEIAELFPEQGSWSEKAYLALDTNRLVEFDDGFIEVLPLPKKLHQRIIMFLLDLINAYLIARKMGGLLLIAGYKIRIPNGKYREPDLIYMTDEQDARSNEDFTTEAEFVVEVVSPDDPDRDYVKKRAEYALAQVPEYWIVDLDRGQVLVLRLENGAYAQHGCFTAGEIAVSHRFAGLAIPVDDILRLKGRP